MSVIQACKRTLKKIVPSGVMRLRYARQAAKERQRQGQARQQGRRVVHFLHVSIWAVMINTVATTGDLIQVNNIFVIIYKLHLQPVDQ